MAPRLGERGPAPPPLVGSDARDEAGAPGRRNPEESRGSRGTIPRERPAPHRRFPLERRARPSGSRSRSWARLGAGCRRGRGRPPGSRGYPLRRAEGCGPARRRLARVWKAAPCASTRASGNSRRWLTNIYLCHGDEEFRSSSPVRRVSRRPFLRNVALRRLDLRFRDAQRWEKCPAPQNRSLRLARVKGGRSTADPK
jgi:hypothetical protein